MPTSKPRAGFRLKRAAAAGLTGEESFIVAVGFVALRGMANTPGGFSKSVQEHLQTFLAQSALALRRNARRKRNRHTLDGMNAGGVATFAFFNLDWHVRCCHGGSAGRSAVNVSYPDADCFNCAGFSWKCFQRPETVIAAGDRQVYEALAENVATGLWMSSQTSEPGIYH